jgi:hypothetical protein
LTLVTALGPCPATAAVPAAAVTADAHVEVGSPTATFNASELSVDADSAKHTFLRITATGIGSGAVTQALLRLTVGSSSSAASDHGGRMHRTTCAWNESTLTWNTAPAIDGVPRADHPAPVAHGDVVIFDLTGAITGDGDHCFALTSPSGDGVRYASRESASGPTVSLSVVGPCAAGGACPEDGLACTLTRCDVVTQACVQVLDHAQCDNSVYCDGAERCDPASGCASSPPIDCDDRLECTADTCDESARRCAHVDRGTCSCLAGDGPLLVLSGPHPNGYTNAALAPSTRIDASAATFTDATNIVPLELGGGDDLCIVGGTVEGVYDPGVSWTYVHDSTRNHGGVLLDGPANSTIEGVRIHNVADGVRMQGGADGFTIRRVWMSYIRDDCVDDHHLYGGVIVDSLLDGCYVGLSARPNSTQDGRGKTIRIIDSVMRLQAYPDPHSSESRNPGHGALFKWHNSDPSRSPALALHGNVVLIDQDSDAGIGVPASATIESCADNVMVWLGPGPFPDDLGTDPATGAPCFTVTTDRGVWDRRVAEWHGGCETDADCNDVNPCTTDACDGGVCRHVAVGDGTACDDGLCCGGVCRLPECDADADCADGSACTSDRCLSPGTCAAACEHIAAVDGAACAGGACCGGVCCGALCCDGRCLVAACSADAACADAEACTSDSCLDPGMCDAACAHDWPACGASDGCCGPDCTGDVDPDCPIGVCGDGVCAGGGENCFTCATDCRCTGKACAKGCCGDGLCLHENAKTCPIDCR